MGEDIKVSVIMSAYNAEKSIEKAIRSVLNSTYRNIELIIVEDCSTDGTVEKIKSIKDNRIRTLYHKENLGAGWSRYDGVKMVTGDYTLFVDSDDWIDSNWIEELVKAAIKSKADIISGGLVVELEKDNEIVINYLPVAEVYLDKDKVFAYGNNLAYRYLNCSMIRSTLWNKVDYCKWRFLEDSPTFIKLLSYANSRQLISCTGYHYYQNPDSLCHTVSRARKGIYRMKMVQDIYNFQKENNKSAISLDHIMKVFSECQFSREDLSEYKEEVVNIEKFLTKIIHEVLWKEVEEKEESI